MIQTRLAVSLIFSSILFTSFGCGSGTGASAGTLAAGNNNPRFQSDPNNCGIRGNVCTGNQPGCCNGVCKDLGTDKNNCRTCGFKCSTINATKCYLSSYGAGSCVSGDDLGCPTGYVSNDILDPGVIPKVNICTYTATNPQHCGFIGPGSACPPSTPYCTNNTCGNCLIDSDCLNGTCSNGNCVCAPGFTSCSGPCVNLQNDGNNCGACGNQCFNNSTCSNGTCVCPAGTTFCSGSCVNLQNDGNNCGACGSGCQGYCNKGACWGF